MMGAIRRYLLAGIIFWVPVLITVFVIRFLVDLLDRSLLLLPVKYRPDTLLGFHLPGLGLIFTLLVVFFTGMIVTNVLGKRLLDFWDRLLAKIPLVSTIYHAVKQMMHTMFSPDGQAFRKVLLVEYPRRGLWSIAFQTGNGFKQAQDHVGEKLVTIFIITTPNPTSGFLMMVPASQTKEINISVDAALKMVISLGVVVPPGQALPNDNKVLPQDKSP